MKVKPQLNIITHNSPNFDVLSDDEKNILLSSLLNTITDLIKKPCK